MKTPTTGQFKTRAELEAAVVHLRAEKYSFAEIEDKLLISHSTAWTIMDKMKKEFNV